jgi:PKD repeat protein
VRPGATPADRTGRITFSNIKLWRYSRTFEYVPVAPPTTMAARKRLDCRTPGHRVGGPDQTRHGRTGRQRRVGSADRDREHISAERPAVTTPTTDWPRALVLAALVVTGTVVVGISIGTAPAAAAGNLLSTPGCETGPQLPPAGWTDASPTPSMECLEPSGFSSFVPHGGAYVFADDTRNDASATIEQTVGVIGGESYEVAGYVGTIDGSADPDYGFVEVEYLDSSGNVLPGGTVLTDLRSAGSTSWKRFGGISTAPASATQAVVRVRAVDAVGGDGGYSDALFDDLSFRQVDPPPRAYDDGVFEVGLEDTLAPANTLFDDNGNGTDDRGSPRADVASFGGGDLGGSVGDNAAGSSAGLAGGSLTVKTDGSFSLDSPTETGRYAFRYRIENDTRGATATAYLRVRDSSLRTPSCEARDGDNRPDDWTNSSLDPATCLDPTTFTGLTAPDGSYVFGDGTDDGDDAEAEQVVPVLADQRYRVRGLVGQNLSASSADYGRVEVVFLDDTGAVIPGATFALDALRPDTATAFDRFSGVTTSPASAEEARVRLVAVDDDGAYAETLFDDVQFGTYDPAPRAEDDGPFEVGLRDTLAPANTLFDDNGNGTDDRGDPLADVASFGGGDLGGTVADNAAGDSASLAGGSLTVDTDGTFSLDQPTRAGRYTFQYRIENDTRGGNGTVYVTVRDSSLRTPSCEARDGDNQPDDWTNSSADVLRCLDPTGFTDLTASDGGYVFGDGTEDGDDAEAEQVVPVLADQYYEVTGDVGQNLSASSADYGRVEVVFLDDTGAVIPGATLTLDALRPDTATAFDRFSGATTSPVSAEEARVRLVAVDDDGAYAETLFDGVSLSAVAQPPTAADDGPFRTTPGTALAPENTLFDDNGNGTDDRGDPLADVASFGGGALGGSVGDNTAGSSASLAGGSLTANADGSVGLDSPTEAGVYPVRYRLSNAGGSDDATAWFVVDGPEVAVTGEGDALVPDGDATPAAADGTDLGSVDADGGTATATFSVENRGTEVLAVGTATVSGADGDYAVTTQPTGTVAPGGSAALDVTVDPSDVGSRTVTVSVPTNDSSEGTYEFTVTAEGTDDLTVTTGTANDVGASAVTARGTVDPGGSSTAVSVEYFPTGSPGLAATVPANETPVDGVDTVAVNATLSGLASDTEYTYRLLADNGTVTLAGSDRTVQTLVDPPEAEAGPDRTVTAGDPVSFDGSGSSDDGTVVRHEWAFGDGSAAVTGEQVAHRYVTAGTYTARLTVEDDTGATDTDTATVRVRTPGITPVFGVAVESTGNRTTEGETVAVTATVTSRKGGTATRTVRLSTGGVVRDATDVTLGPGEQQTVRLEWTTSDGDAGNRTLTVSAETDFDRAAVVVAERVDLALAADRSAVVSGDPVAFTVRRPDTGEPMPARVSASAANWSWTREAGSDGRAVVAAGPPGRYTVSASMNATPTATYVAATTELTVEEPTVTLRLSNLTANVTARRLVAAADVTEENGTALANRTVEYRLDADADGSLEPGETVAADVVDIPAGGPAEATFDVDPTNLSVGGGTYRHGVFAENASLTGTVSLPEADENPFPGGVPGVGDRPPTDADGDPQLEDVDGDGGFSFDDVVALAFVDGEALSDPTKVEALDFDGDGRFTFEDVVALAFDL